MNEIMTVIRGLDWSPLVISLKTGVVATAICFFMGIFAARKVLKLPYRIRNVVDSLLTMPMVLPPTVAGFFLLVVFSTRRPFGAFLDDALGIKMIHTWLGCIFAAVIIAFPLMYRNAKAAFEQIDTDLIHAAETLGMSEMTCFRKVIVPAAGPGLLSGTVLTFARAMGEYGATSMLAGNIPGKTATVSQKIAMVIQDNDYITAGIWSLIVIAGSFAIILIMDLVAGKKNIKW